MFRPCSTILEEVTIALISKKLHERKRSRTQATMNDMGMARHNKNTIFFCLPSSSKKAYNVIPCWRLQCTPCNISISKMCDHSIKFLCKPHSIPLSQHPCKPHNIPLDTQTHLHLRTFSRRNLQNANKKLILLTIIYIWLWISTLLQGSTEIT